MVSDFSVCCSLLAIPMSNFENHTAAWSPTFITLFYCQMFAVSGPLHSICDCVSKSSFCLYDTSWAIWTRTSSMRRRKHWVCSESRFVCSSTSHRMVGRVSPKKNCGAHPKNEARSFCSMHQPVLRVRPERKKTFPRLRQGTPLPPLHAKLTLLHSLPRGTCPPVRNKRSILAHGCFDCQYQHCIGRGGDDD